MTWHRLRQGLTGLAGIASVIGFALSEWSSESARWYALVAALIAIVGVIWWWCIPGWRILWRRPQVRRLRPPSPYTIKIATPDDIDWIAELEADVYKPSDAVPLEKLREWYDVNPSGFLIVWSSRGKRIGHVDILPLKKQPLLEFRKGNLIEKEIRGDSLISPNHRHQIKNLYIESVVIPKDKRMALRPLLSDFILHISGICKYENVENIYAMAATDEGEALLKHLNFVPDNPGRKQRDGHPVYVTSPRALMDSIENELHQPCCRPIPWWIRWLGNWKRHMRPITTDDFLLFDYIQRVAYQPLFVESSAVFLKRLELFPSGCWIVEDGSWPVAYLICHPWLLSEPVLLNTADIQLPEHPDCFYIHSVTVIPACQRAGVGRKLYEKAKAIADQLGYSQIALVSVQGSHTFWSKLGFRAVSAVGPHMREKLVGYGPDALYMIKGQ